MKTVSLTLALSLLVFASVRPHADEDKSVHRPYPSPRKSGEGQAAFAASNVQLMSWLPLGDLSAGATSGNDCWGYTSPSGREYAIIGLSNGTAWVEVTDPGAPVFIAHRTGPNSLWRDIKVYGDNAYAVSEGGSGIQIFDMSNIDGGVVTLVNTVTVGSCTTSTHNVAIDTTSGFLYRCGGGGAPCAGGTPQGLLIYNLGANPDNPPHVGSYTTRYVHDLVVVVSTRPGPLNGQQLAFCAADNTSGGGTANLHILNVTNKAAITSVATGTYTSNSFSHQVWLTPDQRYAYLNDELDEQSFGFTTRTRVFDVSNPAAPVLLGFFTSGSTAIDHNLYVTGDKIFEANYRSGLRVFNNTNPTAPTVYGFFDTWESDDVAEFNGLWSNYPYFPSGTVIGSDLEKGLFVWRLGPPLVSFAYPNGLPEFVGPSGGPVLFEVTENLPGDYDPTSVEFHYSTGGPFTTVPATALGGHMFEAQLPGGTCGAELQYYFTAQNSAGQTWSDPQAGPTQVYQAHVAHTQTVALDETFETNTFWQVNLAADLTGFSTATTGTWTRANPIGTAAQPEDDHSNPGTMCFFTGQGSVGGGVGDADVDGGATSLRSPVINASGMTDPHLSYWRWFSNMQGGNPGTNTMTVHVSNNGGSSWVLAETLGPTGDDTFGGWIKHDFRIANFVAPTNNMLVRFRVSDLNGAIVEAAVDDLRVTDYNCAALTATSISQSSGPFGGGNVVTITGTNFIPGTTTVRFGLKQSPLVNVLNSTTLEATVPNPVSGAFSGPTGRLRAIGTTVDVIVQNPGTDTLPGAYTYQPPPQKSL